MPKFVLILCLFMTPSAEAQVKRVLVLGNSYSAGTAHHIRALFKEEAPEYEFTVLSPGGRNLHYHLNSETTQNRIKSAEKWDLLILQGQSLQPAASDAHTATFQEAVAALVELAKAQKIPRIMLFQTWGRRDGHKPLKDVYPDFETMHGRISEQYKIAAQKNGVMIAPVGDAFAILHKENNELFRGMYKADGSHPTSNAGYLAACVFYGAITGNSPAKISWSDKLDEETAGILKNAAARALEGIDADDTQRDHERPSSRSAGRTFKTD